MTPVVAAACSYSPPGKDRRAKRIGVAVNIEVDRTTPSPQGEGEPTADISGQTPNIGPRPIVSDAMLSPSASVGRHTGAAAFIRHLGYVLAENPVTALAFALFVLLALMAIAGPMLVPFDPYA